MRTRQGEVEKKSLSFDCFLLTLIQILDIMSVV